MGSCDSYEASELFQAQTHLYKHVYSFISSMSLKCAVELNIPDIIHSHGKPIPLSKLISTLQLHPTKTLSLLPFLRLLVHNGFLATTESINDDGEEEEAYALTPPSKLLVKGKEPCLSPAVLAPLSPSGINMWLSLNNWFVGKEESLCETAYGMNYWDFVSQTPEEMKRFGEAMMADSQMVKLALKDCKPVFDNLRSIVDVGGGTGTVARLISEAFPNLKCTVLDLPQVVANIPESKNLTFIGGDMFQSIPSADAVLLKWVLHDWSDEECVKILNNSRKAISSEGKDGKVIIIETVINEKKDDHESTELKLSYAAMMMTLFNGKERTEKEWEKLFKKAGFIHYKITPVFGYKSLIELYP